MAAAVQNREIGSRARSRPSATRSRTNHWRTVVVRTKRAWSKLPGAAKPSDLVLYAGFLPMSATALTAWFLAPGSPPVFGPVALNHLAPERHVWIDLHNFSGLILLPAVILHVRRHVRWMCHTSGTGRRSDNASQ